MRRSIGLRNRLGETPDEQVGQKRWDQVRARTMGSEGATHSPIMPKELFADGTITERFMRDLRRPVSVLVFDQVSDPISLEKRNGKRCTDEGRRT